MPEMIEAQIRGFIVQHFPSSARRDLSSKEGLLENGIIDSLGVLDLVSFIEDAFAITIADDELLPDNFQTIERIARFVEGKCKKAISA